jgi:hypothetical protein
MVHLTGTVVVAYTKTDTGITVHVTTSDFSINQSTISIDSTATYTNDNGSKSLTVETQGSGTGPLGHTVTRMGNYTLTWGDSCFTLDGQWSTQGEQVSRSTTVDNFSRCLAMCPKAGGSIAHTYTNGLTVTVSFDGSAIAAWSASNGHSGHFPLICIPN